MRNKNHILVIAEAGVNHNGSEQLAIELIDVAKASGSDIVKFQTFKASKLVTKNAKQANYQIENTGVVESQYSMLNRLELSFDAHKRLIKHCNEIGIEFLSTAFDEESLAFLVNELGLTRLKIPSGDLTNAPLVLEHALTGCDLIVSTGMATLAEIENALGVIAFGYINNRDVEPNMTEFAKAYYSVEGQKAIKDKVTLLHCTTEYPAPLIDINLNAMDTMKGAFKLPVGYSDHSAGITVPIAAVAKGAVIIEKHFTLDNDMEGPDHKASLEPDELRAMIKGIRDVELVLGDGIKGPRPSEIKNKDIARKSIIALQDIKVGELYTNKNISIKRPGSGVSPYMYWDMLNKKATKSYFEGDVIID
jgi:N-acetylneuraminate synthase